MGFKSLRVLNDEIIEGGGGFGMHPHDNMEIITVVTEGTLEHKDTEGNGGILRPGDVQVMSAGSGLSHSEINRSETEPLSLFQLWIATKERDIPPQYGQKTFDFVADTLVAVASGFDDAGALPMHQDARVLVGNFTQGASASHTIGEGRGAFVFIIEGTFMVGNETLERRDAIEIEDAHAVSMMSPTGGRIIIVETV